MKTYKITLEKVKNNPDVKIYLEKADKYLGIIGYTEHGERHAQITAERAKDILTKLNYSKKDAELAAIAGYLHDIGNVIARDYHGQSGALIAKDILNKMEMSQEDTIAIMSAIGNHHEEIGNPINNIASSLIIADKSDVHKTRVRNPKMVTFDIHDRVNYAAQKSTLEIKNKKIITLNLTIDTKISSVMEYFEIFLSRMIICKRAARFLNTTFEIVINKMRLL